ncbi:MAG: GNAT family N-acetyltransferase [Leptolyngbya sp. SIO1E4]|nr:GNAT family N-acetyltransferase [Leptolyngbya sp. SIO1E4]
MEFDFQPLERHHVLAILGWQYPAPYDCYNFKEDNHQADLSYLLEPQNAFSAILNKHQELEGYCSFGADGQVPGGNYSTQALDIGMGIRPDLTDKGQGRRYALAVAHFGVQRYHIKQLRVTIAEFNQRAQRVWISLGFESVEIFVTTNSDQTFLVLVRDGEGRSHK